MSSAVPQSRPEDALPPKTQADSSKDGPEVKDREKSAAYNAANYFKNEGSQVSGGTHLPEMRPDYVIAISLNRESNDADLERLKTVASALQRQSLYVQFRQGSGTKQALALVKCSSKRLRTQVQRGLTDDWLHGVRTRNPGDDKSNGSNNSTEDEKENDDEENDGLTPAERLRLVYEIITSPKEEGGVGITPGINEWEFVEQIFPLHNYELNSSLIKRWSTRWLLDESEIEAIRKQFGDKVAMYFGFLQFYFRWSLVPTLIGLGTHVILGNYSPLFAILNSLWGIVFIEGWRRRQEQLAIRWKNKGCSSANSSNLNIRRRLSFRPDRHITDPVTGADRPYYPWVKRELKRLSFIPIALLVGAALVAFQAVVFVIEIFMGQIYNGPFKDVLIFLPTVLLVGLTPAFGTVYSIAADYVTNWENHETDESYEVSSTSKQFAFNFLTAFMGLFLTAYVYLPFGHHVHQYVDSIGEGIYHYTGFNIAIAESFELNSWRLHQQVFYFVVTANVINFGMETVVPYVQRKAFSKAQKWTMGELQYNDEEEEAAFLNEVRAQSEYPVYDVHEDYRQLAVQFGYTILFGTVWPLAPMAQIFNNWVQLRGDAVKICLDMQRPVPQRCETVGPWVDNLYFLSWLGSLVSSSLIAMFGHTFSSNHDSEKVKTENTGLVALEPWKILLTVFLAQNAYFLAKRSIHSLFSNFESKEHIESKQQQYKLRQKYLDEKRQIVGTENHHQLGVGTLDPIENQWAAVTQAELEMQASKALEQPQTIKEKKSE